MMAQSGRESRAGSDHPPHDLVHRGISLLHDRARLGATLVAVVAVIVAVYVLVPRIIGLNDAVVRIAHANSYWVVAAVLFNVGAFFAYVLLFRGILGGDARDQLHKRINMHVSYLITMAGLAATRVFSAGGIGGIALTYWALRRAGMDRTRTMRQMAAFLILLYSVYLLALVVFGILLASGILPGRAPVEATLVPAAIAGAVIVLVALISLVPGDVETRMQRLGGRRQRLARPAREIARVSATSSSGVRTALVYLNHPRQGALALVGSVGFWSANIAVLWASFEAFGAAVPIAVLVQGFFLGMAANLIPSPFGGVGSVDAGMIGAFALFGLAANTVFPAVLCFRLIVFWLPIPPGVIAYLQLRRRIAYWDVGSAPTL